MRTALPHERFGGGPYRLLEADSENQAPCWVVEFKRMGSSRPHTCLRRFGLFASPEEALESVSRWLLSKGDFIPEKFRNGRFHAKNIMMFVEVP